MYSIVPCPKQGISQVRQRILAPASAGQKPGGSLEGLAPQKPTFVAVIGKWWT